jgi:hypothetical protein
VLGARLPGRRSPRRENRDLDGGANALDQFEQRRRSADVPAGLDSLGDDRIGSHRLCRLGLLKRAALVDPGAAGKPAWLTPKGHDHVGVRRCLHIARPKQRQHEVHGDRSAGELSRGGQLIGDPSAGTADRSETAGLRYGCRELVAGYSTHSRLNDRRWQITEVEHCAQQPTALGVPPPVNRHVLSSSRTPACGAA